MRSVQVLLAIWISLSVGNTVTPKYKGCFSTKLVEQYAFYYKSNYSLSLEQSTATCNNKLTRFMGLEVDKSFPDYNHVYCGNDLADVSPKAQNDQCRPCQENSSFYCGWNGTMAVYLLRDSTPWSLLLATNLGVEIFSDNMTTLKVAHYNTSSYKTVDYTYTDDTIFSTIGSSFLRSFYNSFTMKYSQHYVFNHKTYSSPSLAVDFFTRQLYTGYSYNRVLYRGNALGTYSEVSKLSARGTSYPEQISVDPYNMSLAFLEKHVNAINILSWSGSFYKLFLSHLHVEKINALSMDIHEMLLYAILTFNGDTSVYLVSLDYSVSQLRMLFRGPQLENATLLEVFRDHAVWLRDTNGVSTVFQCKLTPRCQLENINVFRSNQTIFDFVIYHPEKQTPGRKRLCAHMNCTHGCQLFTPFSAKCSCPPGMDMDPDSSTCKTSSAHPTTSTYSPYESSTIPVDSTTTGDLSTTTGDLSTLELEVKSPQTTNESVFSINEILFMFGFGILVIVILLVVISVLVFDLYKKNDLIARQRYDDAIRPRLELNPLENHYMEEKECFK